MFAGTMCVAHIISVSDIITAGNIICRRQTSLRESFFHANRPRAFFDYFILLQTFFECDTINISRGKEEPL